MAGTGINKWDLVFGDKMRIGKADEVQIGRYTIKSLNSSGLAAPQIRRISLVISLNDMDGCKVKMPGK